MTRFEFILTAKALQREARENGWTVPAFRTTSGPRRILRAPDGVVVKIDLSQHDEADMRAGLEAAQHGKAQHGKAQR